MLREGLKDICLGMNLDSMAADSPEYCFTRLTSLYGAEEGG